MPLPNPEQFLCGWFFFLISVILPCTLFAAEDPYHIVSRELIIEVKGKWIIETERDKIQINSRDGEHAASLSFPYGLSEKISSLTGWVQDLKGNILKKLVKKDIHDHSQFRDIDFYSDQMVKAFSLTYPEYPHQIVVECVSKSTESMCLVHWSPADPPEAVTQSAALTVILPLNYPVSIFQHGLPAPVTDTLEDAIRYTWQGSYLKPLKPEYGTPAMVDMLPEVRIVPLDFTYGNSGSFRSWAAFGIYIDTINHGSSKLSFQDANRILSLRDETKDTLERIRAVYHYVQDHTRYLSVSILKSGIIPATAESVSLKKYGDCKGLSIYTKALLENAGIKAYYTVVYAGAHPLDILSDFPSQQFNHAILCIPYRKDTLWMDCTNEFDPFAYTGTFIQGRPALVVNGKHSALCNIPALNESQVSESRSIRYLPKDDGAILLTFHGIYQGPVFEHILAARKMQSPEENKEFAKKLVPFERFSLDQFNFSYDSRDAFSATLDASFELKENCRRMEGLIVLPIPLLQFPKLEKVSERELPLKFDVPVHCTDTLVIPIVSGFSPKSLPVFSLNCVMGNYRFESRVEDKQVVCIREFVMKRGNYPLPDYPEIFGWISAIRAFERQTSIVLTRNHD